MYQLAIADDEKNIREGLSICYPWEELGFEIAGTFSDGTQVLKFMEQHTVNAVLSDIRMPGMDGLALAEHIFHKFPDVPLVLISGYADFEYARTALRCGVKDYLLKPVKYEALISTFTELFARLEDTHSKCACPPEEEGTGVNYYDQIVNQAVLYLKTHYQNASLLEASEQIGISPNYLSKIFKQQKGVNFSVFLQEVRMKQALHFLNTSMMKTYEIAEAVGYDNPKNFTRAFKQYFGKSPREYRGGELI